MKHNIVRTLLAVSIAALASPAFAQGTQVLWKLVDKKGRVTYADQPPKDFDGVATRIEVPLDARSAPAPSTTAPAPSAGAPRPTGAGPAGAPVAGGAAPSAAPSPDLLKARAKLEEARKAYESGKEPGPEDVVWVGRKGGGARPEISESYAARVRKLEDAVRAAEDEVQRLERPSR